MKPKDNSLTITKNFKVSPTVEAAIAADAAELGITPSAYMRLCVYYAGPQLRLCPGLVNLDRRELETLAADIGKTLVIRPAEVLWVRGGRDL